MTTPTRIDSGKPPRVYVIPSHASFVDCLAEGLLERFGDERQQLSDLVILLPTRRAIRALQEAFLRLTDGAPMLLPRLLAIGEIDDDLSEIGLYASDQELSLAPEVEPLRRRLLLARLIEKSRPDLAAAQALELAAELMSFLDQLQVSSISLDDLDDLAPVDFAAHWQQTILFLQTFNQPWQAILQAEGVLEPMPRRELAIAALLREWEMAAPAYPIIAAGSTGSMRPTARLLSAIARLPRGMVVLPGLDLALDRDSWQALAEDHPQFAMRELLARMRIDRGDVENWISHKGCGDAARAGLLSAAMQPSETTDKWRDINALPASSVAGLHRIDCADQREEATVVALLMRQQLETPMKTVALVTPDRNLGRRVAAELARWQIRVDDSAGIALGETPPGAFLRLLGAAISKGSSPHQLLALMKHPMCRLGMPVARLRNLVRQWDRKGFRGPRPAPSLDGLAESLRQAKDLRGDALELFLRLTEACREFEAALQSPAISMPDILDRHLQLAEWLCHDEAGELLLWHGEDGEAAASFINKLRLSVTDLPPIAGPEYPAMFAELIASEVVRPRYGRHPRLHIWGPLEARLQRADMMILGGLNEGSWPRLPPSDPWLNRPMRQELRMMAPEWRIGMSAHDFVQAAAGEDVVLTRAERADGAPTVPSRWLLRLEQVMKAAGVEPTDNTASRYRGWAQLLDQPDRIKACAPPQPAPPFAARPRRLSATRIQTWMQNPYGLYASHILKLYPLDDIDADPSLADRGTAIHLAIENYVRNYTERPLAQAYENLLDHGRAAFAAMLDRPAVAAFWWPRFERIAAWFVSHDAHWRQQILQSFVEQKGELELTVEGRTFILSATADRLDLRQDGEIEILDYKSGAVPTTKDVMLGEAPQLVLEALILAAGGFDNLPSRTIAGLSYWKLSGGREPGKAQPLKLDIDAAMADADAGLRRLIAVFDDHKTPYRARPRPEVALRYDDYEHLARLKEWSTGEGGRADAD